MLCGICCFFFFQAEDGIRDYKVTGVQTCALPIWSMVVIVQYFFPVHRTTAQSLVFDCGRGMRVG